MAEIYNYLKNNKESKYPTSIDPLLFIQDSNLDNKEWRENYSTTVNDDATAATTNLADNEKFTPINADLFNCLVSRISKLQTYLLNKTDTMLRIEFGDEPTELVDGKIWLKKK